MRGFLLCAALPNPGEKTNMKPILILALAAAPAFADVYKCKSGSKTIYQDVPCTNAKVIDNINGLVPTPEAQSQAQERAARERTFVDQRTQARAIEEAKASRSNRVTPTTTYAPSPNTRPKNTSGRPDRYYDRQDRYYHRSTTTHTGQAKHKSAPESARLPGPFRAD